MPALFGAIVLGVVTNAIWEIAVKPALFGMTDLALNIATLGVASMRDRLYLAIARGDQTPLATFSIVIILLATLSFSVAIVAPLIIWRFIGRILRRLIPFPGRVERAPSLKKSLRLIRFSTTGLAVSAIALCILYGLIAAQVTFISKGVQYLAQAQRIIAPYIDQKQRIELSSRIAQMTNKEDFVSVNSEIEGIARANKLKLPEFSAF